MRSDVEIGAVASVAEDWIDEIERRGEAEGIVDIVKSIVSTQSMVLSTASSIESHTEETKEEA